MPPGCPESARDRRNDQPRRQGSNHGKLRGARESMPTKVRSCQDSDRRTSETNRPGPCSGAAGRPGPPTPAQGIRQPIEKTTFPACRVAARRRRETVETVSPTARVQPSEGLREPRIDLDCAPGVPGQRSPHAKSRVPGSWWQPARPVVAILARGAAGRLRDHGPCAGDYATHCKDCFFSMSSRFRARASERRVEPPRRQDPRRERRMPKVNPPAGSHPHRCARQPHPRAVGRPLG
jgi:hypothetical protein